MTVKNRLHLILAVYLMLAVTGMFTLTLSETCRHNTTDSNGPFSISFVGPIGAALNWILEDSNTISEAQKTVCSLLRNGAPRVYITAGAHDTALNLARTLPEAAKSRGTAPVKKTILLKLRI